MELNISINTKYDIERFILITNIGIMTAIKEGNISIDDAEDYLYSPYSAEKLKNLGINKDVIKMVKLGCRLKDIESLLPDKLSNSIDEIRKSSIELLHLMPKTVLPLKKWID